MTAPDVVVDHVLPEGYTKSTVSAALTALLTQAKQKAEDGLFADASTRILLDISTFKIPVAQNHFFNIVLPNSPYPADSDVLLVIPDDVKTPTDPEVVVAAVKDRLKRAGIEIREVMTLKQLKDEYSTFEGKRQLSKSVDLILSDVLVFKNLSTILGREFYKKKKFPISLKLDPKLEEFDNADFIFALRKTILNICTSGTTSTIVVGQSHLSADELTENVSKICNWLLRNFPGGWENVAKLSVYTTGVPPLIIYMSKGTRDDVKSAVGKSRKVPLPVEDELSTMPGRRVRVHAHGKIDVLNEDLAESDEEIIRELGVEEELKPKRVKNEIGGSKKKAKLNLEDKYVDATVKRQDFEDEEAEAVEASKNQPSRKKKSKKMRKVNK